MNTVLAWSIGPWEIVIILAVILLLFGGRKIPELMEGLGKGVKSFKKGMNEVEGEIEKTKKEAEKPAEETAKKEE